MKKTTRIMKKFKIDISFPASHIVLKEKVPEISFGGFKHPFVKLYIEYL